MNKPKNDDVPKDKNDKSSVSGILDFSGKLLYDISELRKLAKLITTFYLGLIEEGLNEQQALYLTGLLLQPKPNS